MRLESEFTEPFQAWQAEQTPQTSGALLRAVNPIIDTALKTYGGGSAASPTLRGRARQLALEAFPTYDPNKGSMRNHLLGRMQRLRRYTAQENNIISMPEQVALQRQQLYTAEKALEDELGRPPTTSEVADRTHLSAKRIGYIRQGVMPMAEGQVVREGAEGGGNYMPQTTSLAPQQDEWVELVYDDLGPVDKLILEHSLGLHGHPQKNATQIAKMTGLTSGAISQRMQRIQTLLDERDELGGIF